MSISVLPVKLEFVLLSSMAKMILDFIREIITRFALVFHTWGNKTAPIRVYDEPHNQPAWPSFKETGNFFVWQSQAAQLDKMYFGGFFEKNKLIDLIAAMCMVESSGGLNIVRQVSVRDTSYGVMQVTPYTAGDIYKWGGTSFGPPTVDKLKYMPSSLYFGMAYVKILVERFKKSGYEDISRSYNGGPGWKTASATSLANTKNHWLKIQSVLRQNSGGFA